MNDTQQSPPQGGPSGRPAGPDDEFDPRRLRSIADMERSGSEDRVIAGVCAGAAKYLNIDPIVVRVIIAVLTIAGFAGVILYVAAWLLLPADDEEKSIIAQWFKLDRNESQVRVAGLVGAVILAALSLLGNSSWSWWGGSPWWLVPVALVFYVLWVRPRRRRESGAEGDDQPDTAHETDIDPTDAVDPATYPDQTAVMQRTAAQQRQKKQKKIKRPPRSPALFVLTTSLAAITLAATWIYDETQRDVPWTTYIAVALAVVGVGLLIGTVIGDGGPLIAIGILLAITLAIGSVFPSGRIGSQTQTPTVAADVRATYQHGIGELELDLTRVTDPTRLLGRTIDLEAGVGQTTVIVPDGLEVDIDAHLRGGEISLFGRTENGTDVSMADVADPPSGPVLSIRIEQKLGQIEVVTR